MNAQDHLTRLERLARLRETGALSGAEFERENSRLLQRDGELTQIAGEDEDNGQSSVLDDAVAQRVGKPRWPYWLTACLALASGGGWTLAQWSKTQPQEASAASAGLAKSGTSALTWETGSRNGRSAIRALPA